MPELTLESLAARVAELERKLAGTPPPSVIPASRDWQSALDQSEGDEFAQRVQAEVEAAREASRRVAELTNVPDLADNPWWDRFQEAMRENRERMAREDAERWAAEDAAARQAG